MVRQNKADGIIGLTYNPLVVDEALPFVGIDRSFRADIPCVAADNYGGGRLAAEKQRDREMALYTNVEKAGKRLLLERQGREAISKAAVAVDQAYSA